MRAAQLVAHEKDLWLGQLDAMRKGAGIDLPFTCGHETAGWVAEVGSGVTHVRVGDSLLLHPQSPCGYCRAGDDMHCTAAGFPACCSPAGSPSTSRPARAVPPLPEGLDPISVSPLGDAGHTAYRAVK
jgi:NAD+-dependent secondary alcohol dehydrogenase Adh1